MIKKRKKKGFALRLFVLFFLMAPRNGLSQFWTDDPEPVAYKHWEIYLFSSIDKNNFLAETPNLSAPGIEIDYGLLPNLEAHLWMACAYALPPTAPFAAGLGDMEAGLKYRFIQESKYIPQVGIVSLLELPTGSFNRNLGNGQLWMKFALWAQKSWGSWLGYGGGGYAVNHAPWARNYLFAGFLLQKQLTQKITLVGEIFTQGAFAIDTRPFTLLNMGAYYSWNKHWSVLGSLGHSILGESHLIGYLGVLWTG